MLQKLEVLFNKNPLKTGFLSNAPWLTLFASICQNAKSESESKFLDILVNN